MATPEEIEVLNGIRHDLQIGFLTIALLLLQIRDKKTGDFSRVDAEDAAEMFRNVGSILPVDGQYGPTDPSRY